MTAESVVMNKTAVALAADSAVTISGGRTAKTYETANKLFELIKGSNIAALIYSNAELNGTPWETVIKEYRRVHCDFRAPHVEDYFDHFTNFLADTEELLAPDDEEFAVSRIAFQYAAGIRQEIFNRVDEYVSSAGRVFKNRLHEVVVDICNHLEKASTAAADLVAPNPYEPETIHRAVEVQVSAIVEQALSNVSLESRDLRRIARIVGRCITKDLDNITDSGLVIAGFGTNDVFPKYVGTQVIARLNKTLLMQHPQGVEITLAQPGYFETFAQDGPAQGWVNGINSEVRAVIASHWITWTQESLPKTLRKELSATSGLTASQAREASKTMTELAKKQLDTFLDHMDEYEQKNFRRPMLDSISLLPKEELGVLAESLVNITSLKQRMSIFQANTVGGAIDVALISHGDGFVWLKRKHYFDSELNPGWSLTHAAKI